MYSCHAVTLWRYLSTYARYVSSLVALSRWTQLELGYWLKNLRTKPKSGISENQNGVNDGKSYIVDIQLANIMENGARHWVVFKLRTGASWNIIRRKRLWPLKQHSIHWTCAVFFGDCQVDTVGDGGREHCLYIVFPPSPTVARVGIRARVRTHLGASVASVHHFRVSRSYAFKMLSEFAMGTRIAINVERCRKRILLRSHLKKLRVNPNPYPSFKTLSLVMKCPGTVDHG